MTLGILKEADGEQRVAVTPDSIPAILKLGATKVMVERGAGATAFFDDASFEAAGAEIADADAILKNAKVLVKIHPLSASAIGKLSAGQIVIGQFNPLANKEAVEQLLKANATGFSLDMAPRSTRAQALDVLSSMATVGGYKAVLTAAAHLPTFFPMFMTAAGTIKPAKVLILGAGVAGLQAIATAKRLGAVVEAFDVRAAAKEEVLSLGAKFVEVEGAVDDKSAGGYAVEQTEEFKQRQAQLIHDKAVGSDVIICTAQIPGRKAPVLLRKETVAAMKAGAVVVDMAASTGGNCELTENGKTIHPHGVTIIGDSNLAGSVSKDASVMFGKNIVNFLKLILIKNELTLNWEDDIVAATCVAHEGKVVSERVKSVMG
ncbi:MAG TPA: NAD(P)(+) transhydrogenase (Re/Si-specific) subunit alpha [Saprospirales bacterium]|nr:NAD(P)(+) transhydrogenase (Re/Si-specific) subunit alpha [Saprospirales bacterium]